MVLEAGEHVGQHGGWPNGVVVCENDDVCGGVLDAVAHLETFVGKGDGQNAYAVWVDGVGKVLEGFKHFFFGDDEDFFGFADEPAVGGLFEFFASVDGGDNDGDIFRGDVCGVFGEGNGTVGEEGGETY